MSQTTIAFSSKNCTEKLRSKRWRGKCLAAHDLTHASFLPVCSTCLAFRLSLAKNRSADGVWVFHRKRTYLPGFASGSAEGEARWTFLTGFVGLLSLDRCDVCSLSCGFLNLGVSVGRDSVYNSSNKRKIKSWTALNRFLHFILISNHVQSNWFCVNAFLKALKATASRSYHTIVVKLTVRHKLLTKTCKKEKTSRLNCTNGTNNRLEWKLFVICLPAICLDKSLYILMLRCWKSSSFQTLPSGVWRFVSVLLKPKKWKNKQNINDYFRHIWTWKYDFSDFWLFEIHLQKWA